jgi:predicted GNAT family N-acyltransferase
MQLRSYPQRRKHRRKVVYRGDLCPIQINHSGHSISAQIADISIHGLGLIIEKSSLANTTLSAGAIIEVLPELDPIQKAPTSTSPLHYQIVYLQELQSGDLDCVKVGLMQIEDKTKTRENRRHARHRAPPTVKTFVTFEHPLFPLRQVYGELTTISPFGISITSSLRNGDLLPNQSVRLTMNFPLSGILRCYARINGVSISKDGDFAILNFVISSNLREFQEKAVESILMSPNAPTIRELRAQGFAIHQGSAAISFEYKSDQQDLHDIASLRMRAMHHQGELLNVQDPLKLIDSYDQFSRHIIARVNGRLIASTRLIYNNGHSTRVEHSIYGVKLPDWLWEAGFVECGRLVTDPDYRGADLFLNMMRFIGKTILTSGYRYMISSCTTKLERVYLRSGCRKIGSFRIEGDPNEWSLLVVDFENTSKGIGVNPITWNILQRPMVDYLVRNKTLKLNILHKGLLKFYRLFEPMSRKIMDQTKGKSSQ